MSLYGHVVDAVRNANGFGPDNEAGFAAHLQSLTPSLHALRASFRSGRGIVEVDYTRDVTEAYLLAYYPHYVRMAWCAFKFVPAPDLPQRGVVRACAFGTGPAPEPVAVAARLGLALPAINTLELNLFDLEPGAWEWARGISLERVLPHYWSGRVETRTVETVDIASDGLVTPTVAQAVNTADLVVFQNCLNELATRDEHVRENAARLIGAMKPGAVLTMADIANYPTARRCMQVVSETIDDQVRWLHRFEENLSLDVASGLPEAVRRNLFRGGEYPRRNSFPWRCLSAQRL